MRQAACEVDLAVEQQRHWLSKRDHVAMPVLHTGKQTIQKPLIREEEV